MSVDNPLPSIYCPKCLNDTFKILVRLDEEDHKISWYTLQGYCADNTCNAPVTLPEPKDSMGV